MFMFRKFRAIYNNDSKLVTVMAIPFHWRWSPLLAGSTYGRTYLFRHPDF